MVHLLTGLSETRPAVAVLFTAIVSVTLLATWQSSSGDRTSSKCLPLGRGVGWKRWTSIWIHELSLKSCTADGRRPIVHGRQLTWHSFLSWRSPILALTPSATPWPKSTRRYVSSFIYYDQLPWYQAIGRNELLKFWQVNKQIDICTMMHSLAAKLKE